MNLIRRNILILLVAVSVTLNLFFIGALTARYVDRPQRPMEPPSMRWIMRGLDDSTRESWRPRMVQYGEILRPMRGEMFRMQREVNELLAADPVDRQAVADAFARLRAANLRYQEVTHEQLTQVFIELTPAQREQAFRFMSERRSPDNDRDRDEPRRDNDREHNHNGDTANDSRN